MEIKHGNGKFSVLFLFRRKFVGVEIDLSDYLPITIDCLIRFNFMLFNFTFTELHQIHFCASYRTEASCNMTNILPKGS